ncbi:protein-glutamate O-methyltransferase CheR [Roseomonas nepalensis]|uniref:protein-glutamate O-methyltransferase n=1 Tax=Muricoccus nepalensis TaxID=1854500 RepID=A0A502GGJ0_9PROT|nr:protein-glutamate O-methyltransferase CheR [Roseomonas nepalensis]TPG60430.1 protein-glutamate O-methyltransferase CheR [Roseomonas nepalensis]
MTPGDARPDPAFPALKRLVIARTGHAYYEDKDAALWERVRRRLRATGAADAAGYLARLAADEGEWAALESEVTIGETFFFRDAAQFAALEGVILPRLLRRRAATRRLRVWSAGCSTGAEAYSVAILLRRLLGPARADWAIDILGTDISAAALAAARAARFSPWALRGMPAAERARDFTPLEGGRAWQLRPEHRAGVRFERGNLLALLDGRAAPELAAQDLILCRNVLIYLDRARVPDVVRALAERLAPDGWMLLGHAEPDPSFGAFLRPVALPGTTAWRPRAAGVAPEALAPPAAAAWAPLPLPPPLAFWPEPVAAAEPQPASAGPAAALERARAEADAGALEAARQRLREALRHHPTAAPLHHLDGLVAGALGEAAAAEAALRRALYLDSGFVAAHYHLGLLLLERGAAEAGRRSIANAARLARALPGGTVLEEGDGMTAETLLGLARHHLANGAA